MAGLVQLARAGCKDDPAPHAAREEREPVLPVATVLVEEVDRIYVTPGTVTSDGPNEVSSRSAISACATETASRPPWKGPSNERPTAEPSRHSGKNVRRLEADDLAHPVGGYLGNESEIWV